MITALERAQTYAAIFINAGENWRNYVPVDATVTGDTVHLQGVRMERSDNGWRLEANGETWVVRAKADDRTESRRRSGLQWGPGRGLTS